jgi:hypothetical protein
MRTTFQVELSAYRGDEDESWRLGRLEDWMSWYAFKMGHPMHSIHSQIESLHDHKGCLTVTFTQKPSQPMIDFAKGSWGELGETMWTIQYAETVKQIVLIEENH